jgi:hypothetical protein
LQKHREYVRVRASKKTARRCDDQVTARTRPTEREKRTVDDISVRAGDPFDYATPKTPTTDEKRLHELEERLAHELLDDEERQELRDQVLRLRRLLRRLSR